MYKVVILCNCLISKFHDIAVNSLITIIAVDCNLRFNFYVGSSVC